MSEEVQVPDGYRVVKFNLFDKWFIRWHGLGEPGQDLVYRCTGCRRLLTHNSIAKGPCGCGMNKIYPTHPKWYEFIRLALFPWTIK